MALERGDSNKMKGSTSMPSMNPCTTIITNPTKVAEVPRDGGEHVIKSNMEEEKFDEETQHDDIVEKTSL
jgi:hypothetical protein